MAANRTIKVDVWSKIRERITVVQREILGRSLTFQLYSGATPINLTGGTVTLYAILPDDVTEVFNACTLTTPASGICTYTFTEATLLQAGDLRCWLVYVDSSANELRTQEFAIEVQSSPDFTTSVEGTSEYTALDTALSTYSGIDARVTAVEGDLATAQSDIDALETATTANNLLTAIKSVDGAGSGLDADTLDGNSSADFSPATHNHDTAYAKIGSTTTPDSITDSGLYTVLTAFTGVMIHLQWDINYAVQIRHVSGGSVIQFRVKAAGTWGSWGNI